MFCIPSDPDAAGGGGRRGTTVRKSKGVATISRNGSQSGLTARWQSQTVHPFDCLWHDWALLDPLDQATWSVYSAGMFSEYQSSALRPMSGMQCWMIVNAFRRRIGQPPIDTAPTNPNFNLDAGGAGFWFDEGQDKITMAWNTGFSQPLTNIMLWYGIPQPFRDGIHQYAHPKKTYRIFGIVPFHHNFNETFALMLAAKLPPNLPFQSFWWIGLPCDANGNPGMFRTQNHTFTPGSFPD